MPRPTISVIVPNYQGKKVFPACIKSLLKQNFSNYELVFVDDSSTDGSRELAKQLFGKEKKVVLTRTKKNSGYVGACNQGLRKSRGTYVIVTNNDATFPKNWLTEMFRCVKNKKTVGSSLVLEPGNKTMIENLIKENKYGSGTLTGGYATRILNPTERKTGIVNVVHAGVLIIPRTALKNYIFLPQYVVYGEDIELCWRLRLRGYNVVANTKARMKHIGGYTKKVDKSYNKRAIYHGTKNTWQNFLTFYEAKNLIRIAPLFVTMQIALMVARPRELGLRLKAVGWFFLHTPVILKRRRQIQRSRSVPDEKLFTLISYKVNDPSFVKNSLGKGIVRILNGTAFLYCKLVGLRTFDM